jgi:Ca-activated chloride channel family protein
MNTECQVGLLAEDKTIPLEGVRIDASLRGACVDVTVTQRYRNREAVPVEAVYVFPLEESAAVCGFAALVGGSLIRGKACDREAAFARYDDAMLDGDGAFLLDQERPNIFTASVGNLRPGEQVELQIRYVALATRDGNAVRLSIPTTVAPRYVPKGPAEVGEPEASRVNPEHWPSVPYGLSVTVDISEAELRRVESPSHPIRNTLRSGGATVELAQDEVALDRDFVLLIERAEPQKPVIRVAREDDGRRVAMLTFMPEDVSASEKGHEVLFLLDCSGSMAGDSIAQARRALQLCVRALHADDTFNVVCFGSTHKALWPAPRTFDEESLEEATRHIESIEANLGGTEILRPLTALLEAPHDALRERRVLVLTDGQVSNEADVMALARKYENARIFAFGIGAGASEYLVRGMARASRGAADLIYPGERIEPKVLRMFGRVRTPVLDDIRLNFRGLSVEQAPRRTPPIFAGDLLTVFARIESGSTDHVELVAGGLRFAVELDLERAEAGGPIPILWARESIRELDDLDTRGGSQQKREKDPEQRRARLVELGTRYGLLSSATSYVAVEERSASDKTSKQAELRRIPVALTTGSRGDPQRTVMPMAMFITAPPMAGSSLPPSPSPYFQPTASAGPLFMARAKQAVFSSMGFSGGQRDGDDDDGIAAPTRSVGRSRKLRATMPSDPVFDLLMTQRADGSFATSPILTSWLGKERHKRMCEACAAVDEALVVTCVVIALLEREAADRASEWSPAMVKARAWCARQQGSFDVKAVL